MSPEAQRIAIAEACEFINVRMWSESCIASMGINAKGEYWGSLGVPDYLYDLNVMHEAEKVLTNQQKEKYLDILSDFTEGRRDTSYVWHDTVFATATQRAEAYLRTLNLWEP